MSELFPPSLADQIAAVRREIVMRERVYPWQVRNGRMSQAAADRELAAMRAVLATLEEIAAPVEQLRGTKPLVLYFADDADRDEAIAAFRQAKPDMRTVKL